MVVNLRRGAPVSAGTTLPSAGGLLRDPSCSQLDPSRTLPMESCCPGVKSCVQSVGAAPKKKKKKKYPRNERGPLPKAAARAPLGFAVFQKVEVRVAQFHS